MPILVLVAAVVLLLPLPYGGWRDWAVSLVEIAVGLAAAAWAVMSLLSNAPLRIAPGRIGAAILLFALLIAWTAAQAWGGTPEAWWHPGWREAGAALGHPLHGAVAIDPDAAWAAMWQLLAYGIYFFLVLQLASRTDSALLVLRLLVASAGIYAVYGLLNQATAYELTPWVDPRSMIRRLSGTFDNWNNFGAFLGIGLIAAGGLIIRGVLEARGGLEGNSSPLVLTERIWRAAWLPIVAAVAMAPAIFFTGSRAALATISLGLIVLAATAGARGKVKRALPYVILGLLVVWGLAIAFGGDDVIDRAVGQFGQEDERFPIWRAVVHGIEERGLLGFGLGGFEEGFRRYRPVGIALNYREAHSDILEAIFTLGIPAAVALFLIVLLLAGACATALRTRLRHGIYPCIALGVTVQLVLHSFVDFSVQVPAVALSALTVLAIGVAQAFRAVEDRGEPEEEIPHRRRRLRRRRSRPTGEPQPARMAGAG